MGATEKRWFIRLEMVAPLLLMYAVSDLPDFHFTISDCQCWSPG